ncbi:hypothetical protein [Halobaculum roseum]|uniref:Uncharacterized protein n=1 Tax=Halobaculum roseum TaxID=2175149 RepID=A0ABD5MIR1_9EURY|nr:hypothetical protein [Halobaculum roseum]QZY04235.1 hypothetical protein K6T36_16110 [Halobaculum roseum]
MGIEDEDEFSYDGQLVFNGLHTTTVLDADFDFEEVVDTELINFSPGTMSQPGRGYTTIPFLELLEEEPRVSDSLQASLGEIKTLRYIEEQWEELEVEIDGVVEEKPTKAGQSTFDAYWARPDFLFVRGDKTNARLAKQLLESTLNDYIELDPVTFSPDFLLWLFSQEKNQQSLPGQLSVNMLTDAKFEGDEPDLFGKQGRVSDSTDVTKSIPVLMGVLRQMGIVELEGVFNLAGMFVRARISSEGRVHILADHAIEGSPDIERMAISIAFLQQFTELYGEWKQMDGEQRYPPEQFFIDIYEECDRQGVDIQFSIDQVIEEYRQKGGPEEYQQYQAGLTEYTD